MTRSTAPVLLTTGVVAGRPYLLAVGMHGLGVWLPAHRDRREFVTVVHQPLRTLPEVSGVVAVAQALAYGF